MSFKTADLCDTFESELGISVHVVAPIFKPYGARASFSGRITTLKIFEDNTPVRSVFSEAGQGRVLVIDGGGSLRCALVGDQLARLAQQNGWEGIVVFGAIRDANIVNTLNLGVRALATHPQRSLKKCAGERDLPVFFGQTRFIPGDFLYADADGIVVAGKPLSAS